MQRTVTVAERTTTICPNCGGDTLTLLRSRRVKWCHDCPTEIVWPLDEGQKPLLGGNRNIRSASDNG